LAFSPILEKWFFSYVHCKRSLPESEQQPSGSGDGYSKPARDSLKKLIEKPAAR
jgi:hypothetical protein